VAVGEPVIFMDRSTDPDGQIVLREWDLDGDGIFDDASNRLRVRARYLNAQCATVRLRVTDNAGNSSQAITVVTVYSVGTFPTPCPPAPDPPPPVLAPTPESPPPPVVTPPAAPPPANVAPTAAFAFAPQAPRAGDGVDFVSGSADPDGTIAAQEWDLDADGQFDDASGPSARRVFASAGAYAVSLRVTDDRGAATVASKTVTVAGSGVLGRTDRSMPRLTATVRIRGVVQARTVRIRRLTVRTAAGSTIVVRCSGTGCPYRQAVAQAVSSSRDVRFRRFEKSLRFGTIIRLMITKSGRIGKYTRFKLVSGEGPDRADRCLRYGSTRPFRCPAE